MQPRAPLLPDNQPPLGIPPQQLARWARLALFVAALVIILIVMFAGVTARVAWLWSRSCHERLRCQRPSQAPRRTAGEIERSHEALRKMLSDLESLDATILQFEPDFKVETIKPKAFRPPKDWSNRGQMSRNIL
jgi:hypothetical protein